MTIEQQAEERDRLQPLQPRPQPGGRRAAGGTKTGEPDGMAYLLRMVGAHRAPIAALVLASLAAGVLYLSVATPRYQSNLLIRVERPSMTGVITDPTGAAGDSIDLEPEVEVLRSRSLLGEVVDEFGLAIEAAPMRFPVVGAAIARRHSGDSPAPPRLGLVRYGWGGERIRVERLEVADPLLDVALRLVALEGGRYRILGADGARGFEGQVGQPTHGADHLKVDLLVSELVARPGTEFILRRRRAADAVVALQTRLGVFEKAKKSGVISVTLDGPDPKQTAAILDTLAARYLGRGKGRALAEAEQALQVVESQLATSKARLDAAEAALAASQQRRRITLSTEGQAIISERAEVGRVLGPLEQEWAELRQRYTDNHPAMIEVTAKLSRVRARMAALDARLRQLPQAELEAGRLARDTGVVHEQYQQLVREAERLRIAKAGAAPHATILDPALVPSRPRSPRAGPVLSLAMLLGLAAGIGLAFVRSSGRGASSIEQLERETGLPVLAALPHSRAQRRASRARRWHGALPVLSVLEPGDAAVDELWALRASLELLLARGTSGVVAVLGPGPEVGKSFVCANLAQVFASAGRRVLLLDADLRRGALHRYFGAARQPGLSELMTGPALPERVVFHASGLDLLSCGAPRAAPMELLSGPAFETLLAEFARRYDVVVVDTAPLLAVADALAIARLADVNLLVLRAGKEPGLEAAQALQRLERAGVRTDGLVLNDVRDQPDKYAAYRAGPREDSEGKKSVETAVCSTGSDPGAVQGT